MCFHHFVIVLQFKGRSIYQILAKNYFGQMWFQLSIQEWEVLRSQTATPTAGTEDEEFQTATAKRRTPPFVFTEQGVSMLSAVLSSDQAIQVSLQIMQAFVAMRKTLNNLQGIIQRLDGVEIRQLQTDSKLEQVLQALEKGETPRQGVFFEGQLFDAHVFVSELIRQANKRIVLVDNYANETTLLLLSKRKRGVDCILHTLLRPALQKDLQKHNLQYPAIEMLANNSSHDRFLIIDDIRLYHIGASLKDLGNKCFAFSRMDDLLPEIQTKLLRV
ncbi:MAG: ORF6N domain-containing protein [Bacteroidetes bacterium]|nr:ORF6N domain-containing protein [Bacteroidota bacterium]